MTSGDSAFPTGRNSQSRRHFLRAVGFGAALFSTPGLFAEQLLLTPRQTEGPFYPDKLPLDTDNDLIVINDAATPALGDITWLSGRILDSHGGPIRNATVEIWQVDHNGVYIHSGSSNSGKHDKNFQDSVALSLDPLGNMFSARSNRSPIPAARRIFILRSR